MMTHEKNNHPDHILNLLRQLPRVTAPANFEEVTLLRRMLKELPRASAPEDFEEQVLRRLKEEHQRRKLPRIRWNSPRTWFAAATAAAVVGAIVYYFVVHFAKSPKSTPVPSQPVIPYVVPADTQLEQTIAPVPERKKEPSSIQRRKTEPSTSVTPSKKVSPGVPEHEEE